MGVHLRDGRIEIRRAESGAPILAVLDGPDHGIIALDPRGAWIGMTSAAHLSLVSPAGTTMHTVELPADFAARAIEFRGDGERLWVFGTVGSVFHALAFDRGLVAEGRHTLTLAEGPYPTTINVHPTTDAFVLTTNEDRRDPEATIRRIGVAVDGGVARVVFEVEDIDYPCVGFTSDGHALVGSDLFRGTTLHSWPDYQLVAEAPPAEGDEGCFDAIVVGDHILTERHPAETTDSTLVVLAVPSLAERDHITWGTRGAFGKPGDHAGIDLGAGLGSDRFLEVSPDPDHGWTLRIWQLEVSRSGSGLGVPSLG